MIGARAPRVGSVLFVPEYVHGYATPEQQRLVAQAEHWRRDLIADGTTLEPGTRLLEIGCGVGAVMAVLGQEFPGIELTGVDIEARQLEFARRHIAEAGLSGNLVQADALALPLDDESFDHVWMMWFLEHLADPVAALREARRVLAPGGAITAIEVDYATCHADPPTQDMEALFATMVQGMAAAGRSDAGTHLARWLAEAGFDDVDPGERRPWWQGAELARQANYAADVMESALGAMVELPGAPGEQQLRRGLADLRALADRPGAGLGWAIFKSQARAA
jgi:ubiquinone/menaquinone biosynthesis C-methylase UbiE